MIRPGAMLGMLGGGQLGRFFTFAAQDLGYRVTVLDPDPGSPAGAVADVHLRAAYDDPTALDRLAGDCAAVSVEFENVPAASLRRLADRTRVQPGAEVLAITQNRIREKRFLSEAGLPVAPYRSVRSRAEAAAAFESLGAPCLLKRADFGYDGKGQAGCDSAEQAREAFESLGAGPCVLERRVDLALELSVVLARDDGGETVSFPVAENRHQRGILARTVVPARIEAGVAREAEALARRVAGALDYRGVAAVELFVERDGALLVNEIAPRPHNSGHYSLDACVTSQFEQQVRTLCGLPLGETRLLAAAAMVNLLGERWAGGEPAWERVLATPGARLHLYGKREARPGRKMGHFCVLAGDAEGALAEALRVAEALGEPGEGH